MTASQRTTFPPNSIPIVLTATIVPQTTGAMAAGNPDVRRAEYLSSIAFYRQFAPVYFLENSPYPLLSDPDFAEAPDFHPRQFPPSESPQRGKGYQEFEMLDRWLQGEREAPPVWLKISGRYRVGNVAAILEDYAQHPPPPLVIDQSPLSRFARTYLFLATTAFYQKHLQGLCRQCDDATGAWIERVLYRALRDRADSEFEVFRRQPALEAVQGTTGKKLARSPFGVALRQCLRRANRLFDPHYLRYTY